MCRRPREAATGTAIATMRQAAANRTISGDALTNSSQSRVANMMLNHILAKIAAAAESGHGSMCPGVTDVEVGRVLVLFSIGTSV